MKVFEHIQIGLDEDLKSISKKELTSIEKAEQSIRSCSECLRIFKKMIATHSFEHENNEIQFFKHVKPQTLAKLFYYTSVLKMEQQTSCMDKKGRLNHYRRKLKKIQKFTRKNIDFIIYYRSNHTYLDSLFFKRNNEFVLLAEPTVYQYDTTFCTSRDYLAAKVLAKEELAQYIMFQIELINNPEEQRAEADETSFTLKWTESIVALVELVYGLIESGAVNSGKVKIKQLAAALGKLFNVDLSNCSNKYIEIKERKFNNTKFLMQMVNALEKKIDDDLKKP